MDIADIIKNNPDSDSICDYFILILSQVPKDDSQINIFNIIPAIPILIVRIASSTFNGKNTVERYSIFFKALYTSLHQKQKLLDLILKTYNFHLTTYQELEENHRMKELIENNTPVSIPTPDDINTHMLNTLPNDNKGFVINNIHQIVDCERWPQIYANKVFNKLKVSMNKANWYMVLDCTKTQIGIIPNSSKEKND